MLSLDVEKPQISTSFKFDVDRHASNDSKRFLLTSKSMKRYPTTSYYMSLRICFVKTAGEKGAYIYTQSS